MRSGDSAPAGDPPANQRPERQKRGDRNKLTAENDAIDIDGRLPLHLTLLVDNEHARRAGIHAESATSFMILAAAAAAAADSRYGKYCVAVDLDRLAKYPVPVQHSLSAFKNLFNVHDDPRVP